jgi:hypothetical protein
VNFVQFSLKKLLIIATLAPPVLAVGYWITVLAFHAPVAVLVSAAWLAAVILGPIAVWRELISEICGPSG